MPDWYERVGHFFSRCNLYFAVLGAIVLAAVTTLIFAEVALRTMFGSSRLWVIEVSEYSLVYLTFLGAPYLLEKNRHVVIDLVVDALKGGSRRTLLFLNEALGTVLCAILTYAGVVVVIDQIQSGIREATVMVPPKSGSPLCFRLACSS